MADVGADRHLCHEAADDDSGARMDPLPRACGHSDDTPAYDSIKPAVGKSRSLAVTAVVARVAEHTQAGMRPQHGDWPPGRISLPRVLVPLNSPLRL
jgi:hypothetical protein